MNTLLLPALDLLVKSTGIILLAFALQSFWRYTSASRRSLVWGVTFTLLALLPATLLLTPRWSVGPVTSTSPSAAATAAYPTGSVPTNAPVISTGPNGTQSSTTSSWGTTELLLSIWLTGGVLVLAHRLLGTWQLGRMRRQSLSMEDARVQGMVTRLTREAGIQRPIELLQSAEVPVPLTWGVIHPVLQIPQRALTWSDASLQAALRHELGHIRHRDAATRLLATVVCAVFWPHPLIWLAARAWRTAQEQACDDLVLRSGATTEIYAMQLLDAARSMNAISLTGQPVMAMARPSTLETRLSAIMDERRSRQPLERRAWVLSAATAAMMLFTCAALQIRAQENAPSAGSRAESLMKKAQQLVVPNLSFRDATLKEVVDFLRRECERQDPTVNALRLVLAIPEDQLKTVKITLQLKNAPLHEALNYVTQLAGVRFRYDNTAIIVIPAEGKPEAIVTNFYSGLEGIVKNYKDAQSWLETQGIQFPPGTDAVLKGKSFMIIHHYAGEIDKVNLIVEKYRQSTGQTPQPAGPAVDANAPRLKKKAAAIIIPRVDFSNTPLEDAVKFLQAEAVAHDPEKQGVNLTLKNPGSSPAKIYLVLREVPLTDALRYVASLAKLNVTYEENAVVMGP